jgi:DNA-binding transcriptional LysR family regulator
MHMYVCQAFPEPILHFCDRADPRVAANINQPCAVVAPIWARFLSTYPEIHLELAVGEAPIDIVAKGFDAGIGPQNRAAADMIAVRVMGPMKIAVVGAPSYFANAARRARPMISSVTAAFNIGRRPTALYSFSPSSGTANRGGFRWMDE